MYIEEKGNIFVNEIVGLAVVMNVGGLGQKAFLSRMSLDVIIGQVLRVLYFYIHSTMF